MALTKVGKEGITGVSNSSDATFLTATSSEGVTFAGTLTSTGTLTASGNASIGGTFGVTGVHTLGNNAIHTSDGGAVTQNLVQGLIKVWITQDGTASNAAAYDSFNVSGTTDNGTGDYTVTISNDMSNINYSVTSGGGQQTGSISSNDIGVFHKTQQTGQYGVQTTRYSSGNNSTLQENSLANSMVGGDLA